MTPSLTTEQLVTELANIREQMENQAKIRHRLNNELTTTLGVYSMHTSDQATRLTSLESAVSSLKDSVLPLTHLADDLRDIKQRLIGDDVMKSDGLIQQHQAVVAHLASLDVKATANADDIKRLRMERTITVTVLATIGGIVAFLKSTSVIKWLSGN